MHLSINELIKMNLDSTLLLLGETGTGKSYWAKKIHESSSRKHLPFVTMNMATFTDELLASELFGHVKGSFTGASCDKLGHVAMVGDGTLFLDEIGELSLLSQKKLLMLLEEKIYYCVGSCSPLPFRGRVIAATNKNLEKLIDEGKFRSDLFSRLRVFTTTITPLRNDKQRLNNKLQFFVEKFSLQQGRKNIPSFDSECLHFLNGYSWPHNVREVKNAMEFSVIMLPSDENKIQLKHLPSWLVSDPPCIGTREGSLIDVRNLPFDYYLANEVFEKQYFLFVLERFEGKIAVAADHLRISKSTLIAKVRKYDINIQQFKRSAQEREIRYGV